MPRESTDSRGNACECVSSTALPGIFDCDLPDVCGEFDDLCNIQALRWGMVGSYPQEYQIPDKGGFYGRLEVIEPGLAHRRINENEEFQCCNGEQSNSLARGDYPRLLPPPMDPGWMDCFMDSPTGDMFEDCSGWAMNANAGTCTGGPVAECPEPPPPVPPGGPCEETCPMADDGVCDEPGGSGLCPEGCDPIDCTCMEDVPGQCDEVTEGGPCPIGSDPDFCLPFE